MSEGSQTGETRCAIVAVAGRPNVGKSTLVNAMVGSKVAIVSTKPQTTRRPIRGVLTGAGWQLVLVDLPGAQRPRDRLTGRMQTSVIRGVMDADVVLMVVDGAEGVGSGDHFIAHALARAQRSGGLSGAGPGAEAPSGTEASPDVEAGSRQTEGSRGHEDGVVSSGEGHEGDISWPGAIGDRGSGSEPESGHAAPVVLAVNKVDRLKRARVARALVDAEQLQAEGLRVSDIFPVSASKCHGLGLLTERLVQLAPEGPFLFPVDQTTDLSEDLVIAELVREQVLSRMREEVPHAVEVKVEEIERREAVVAIRAHIWVDSSSQKAIVIGKGGRMIKEVGTAARREIEHQLDRRVHLDLRVTVQKGWRKSDEMLDRLGLEP